MLLSLLLSGGIFGFYPGVGAALPTDGASVITTVSVLAASGELAAMDLEFWSSIKDSNDAESYKAYLESFPNGKFAPLARIRVKKFGGAAPAVAPLYSQPSQPVAQQQTQTATRSIRIVPTPQRPASPQAPSNAFADLVQRACAARRANRLTTPSNNSAVKWARQVLEIQPGNSEAYGLINGIIGTYLGWSRAGVSKGAFNKAEVNLGKAQGIERYASAEQIEEMRRLRKQITAGKARAAQVASLGNPPGGSATTRSLGSVSAPPTASTAVMTTDAAPRKKLERWIESLNGMNFVRVQAGCFSMGSPSDERGRFNSEKPHQVCVDPFWMATQEVTNAQYRLFDPDHSSRDHEGLSLDEPDQPVVFVTWAQATKYAKWLSEKTGHTFRLPTEAEWEYAARAGSSTARFWGEKSKDACIYANVQDEVASTTFDWHWPNHQCTDGYAVSSPVGQFQPNAFGLFDMLGNVWEWTCSPWSEEYDGSEKRCESKVWGPSSRAVRGGSWVNVPRNVRSAFRQGRPPAISKLEIGFRLVRE